MKLLITAVAACLLAWAELLLPFCYADGHFSLSLDSAPDAGTLLSAALLFALLNTPVLYWLREARARQRKSAAQFVSISALILNAPIFLLAAFLAGRTLPFERALLFISALVVVSLAFGLGFIWSLPKQKLRVIRSSTSVVKDLR